MGHQANEYAMNNKLYSELSYYKTVNKRMHFYTGKCPLIGEFTVYKYFVNMKPSHMDTIE